VGGEFQNEKKTGWSAGEKKSKTKTEIRAKKERERK
jgi:hypothetical protein